MKTSNLIKQNEAGRIALFSARVNHLFSSSSNDQANARERSNRLATKGLLRLDLLCISLILLTTLYLSSAQAVEVTPTFDLAVYAASEDDFDGFNVGTTIAIDNTLFRIDLQSSKNLGGIGIAIGRQLGAFTLLFGAMAEADLENESGFIDVAGVQTFDASSGVDLDTPLFIEVGHSSGFFIRYTEYKGDYTLDATRFELIDPGPPPQFQGFSDSENFEIDDSVVFIGYRKQF